MRLAITIVLLIIIAYLFYIYYYQHSIYNTISVPACETCEKYNVHRSHEDKLAAASLMEKITKNIKTLIDHLKSKYIDNKFKPGDPLKNNRIDIVSSDIFPWDADSMFQTNIDGINNIEKITESEYTRERINQLINYYNPSKIYEISPLNNSGVTSYTQDKKTLILCLRKKEKDKNGDHELHDLNTIMFVVIHELSHMMNNLWGHKMNFWVLFKFMLLNAIECGIYQKVDYSKYPIIYCGLNISYSVLYDNNV